MQTRSSQRSPTLTERPAHPLTSLWTLPRTHPTLLIALFWAALLALCATRAYIGLYGTRVYAHDAFMVLDGAWRMRNGQRPHLDFNSMIGPAAYLPTVLGLRLSGNTAAGFGYGQALTAFTLGAAAFFLGARLALISRLLFAFYLACIAASPAILGPSPFNIGPGMTYNRYTYALLGLVMLECLQPEGSYGWLEGACTGVIIAVLAFLKITGFVVGAALLLALATFCRKSLTRWLGLLAGFALVSLGFLAYLHFRIDLVLHDLAITAGAKHVAIAERYDLNVILFEAVMALVIVYAAAMCLRLEDATRQAKHLVLAASVIVAANILLVFGNFQRSELPLVTLFLIFTIHPLVARHGQHPAPNQPLLHLTLVAATAYVGAGLAAVALSFAISLFARVHTVRHATPMQTAALASFVPIGDDYAYADLVNDGLRLLRANLHPGERVMSLDFANPFLFGLRIPPAPGGTTNLQFRGSFDETHKVPPEQLFGAYELLMQPVQATDPNLTSGMEAVYGPFVRRHYALVARSKLWHLYRRLH